MDPWMSLIRPIVVVTLLCILTFFFFSSLWSIVGFHNINAFIDIFVESSIYKYVLTPELRVLGDPAFHEAVAFDLFLLVQQSILAVIKVIFIVNIAWIILSKYRPMGGFLLILGAFGSALIAFLQFQDQGDDLIRSELMIPFIIIFVVFFGVFSFVCIRLSGYLRPKLLTSDAPSNLPGSIETTPVKSETNNSMDHTKEPERHHDEEPDTPTKPSVPDVIVDTKDEEESFLNYYSNVLTNPDLIVTIQDKFSVIGLNINTDADQDELAFLVEDQSGSIENSDFWAVGRASDKEYDIYPGVKQNRQAGYLVADDGINAHRVFNGIMTIQRGSSFTIVKPARATRQETSFNITHKGVILLPF